MNLERSTFCGTTNYVVETFPFERTISLTQRGGEKVSIINNINHFINPVKRKCLILSKLALTVPSPFAQEAHDKSDFCSTEMLFFLLLIHLMRPIGLSDCTVVNVWGTNELEQCGAWHSIIA